LLNISYPTKKKYIQEGVIPNLFEKKLDKKLKKKSYGLPIFQKNMVAWE